jgi:DNA-damage-inducible protein J
MIVISCNRIVIGGVMATKTVSIRMDEELYSKFSQFADRVYIPVSALFSAFAATTVREQRIPFEIAVDPFDDPAYQSTIIAAIDQLESGKGVVRNLIEE